VCSVLASACGDDAQLAPLERPPDAAVPDGASSALDAGAKVRSIEFRNPFGNASRADNLLVDGDFELTGGDGQYGWRSVSSRGAETLARETGGLCRSGVACGVLTPAADLIAFGAAPRDAEIEISLWAKPPQADCHRILVSLISCSSLAIVSLASVLPSSDTPDATGWCRYRGLASPMDDQPCLYLRAETDSNDRVLIDEAFLGAAQVTPLRRLAATVPREDLLKRMQHALRWIHEHKQFGEPIAGSP
jgi:hypothetical protein